MHDERQDIYAGRSIKLLRIHGCLRSDDTCGIIQTLFK